MRLGQCPRRWPTLGQRLVFAGYDPYPPPPVVPVISPADMNDLSGVLGEVERGDLGVLGLVGLLVSQHLVDGGRPRRDGHVDRTYQVHVDANKTLECVLTRILQTHTHTRQFKGWGQTELA